MDKGKVSKQLVKQMIKSSSLQNRVDGWWDSNSSFNNTTTPTFVDLAAIPQATGANNRLKNTITIDKIIFNWDHTLGDSYNLCRLTLFKWFPSDTVDVPQTAEMFSTSVDIATLAKYPVRCPFLASKPSRFKILYDRRVDLDVAHVIVSGQIVLKNLGEISFDVGVNTGKNHIYMMASSDSGAIAHPVFTSVWTVFFHEN